MPGEIDQDAIDLYTFALTEPEWTLGRAAEQLGIGEHRLRAALATLTGLMLLRPASGEGRSFDAVGPEAALAEHLADEERGLRRRQAEIAETRAVIGALTGRYRAARRARRRLEAIDVVDADTAARVLRDWARQVRDEIVVLRRVGDDDRPGTEPEPYRTAMARGAVLRVVVAEAGLELPATAEWVAELQASGARIRTVAAVPDDLVVQDRERAMLPAAGGPRQGAVVVREPGVVDLLLSVHEQLWNAGRPLDGPAPAPAEPGDAADAAVRGAVLLQLATGAKDEMIARRLGISVRSCRRHVAEALRELDAGSRFQAGVNAERAGLLGTPPEPGTVQ